MLEVKVLADGNCGFNSLAMHLLYMYRNDQFHDIKNPFLKNALIDLMEIVANNYPDLGLKHRGSVKERFENFEKAIVNNKKQFDYIGAQKILARSLRIQLAHNLTMDSEVGKKYFENLAEGFVQACTLYIPDAAIPLDEPFDDMPELLNEVEKQSESDDFPLCMKDWFLKKGYLIYLHNKENNVGKGILDPNVEIGDMELGVIGEVYGVNIYKSFEGLGNVELYTLEDIEDFQPDTIVVDFKVDSSFSHWDLRVEDNTVSKLLNREYLEQKKLYDFVNEIRQSRHLLLKSVEAKGSLENYYNAYKESLSLEDINESTLNEFLKINKISQAKFYSNEVPNVLEMAQYEIDNNDDLHYNIDDVKSMLKSTNLGSTIYDVRDIKVVESLKRRVSFKGPDLTKHLCSATNHSTYECTRLLDKFNSKKYKDNGWEVLKVNEEDKSFNAENKSRGVVAHFKPDIGRYTFQKPLANDELKIQLTEMLENLEEPLVFSGDVDSFVKMYKVIKDSDELSDIKIDLDLKLSEKMAIEYPLYHQQIKDKINLPPINKM